MRKVVKAVLKACSIELIDVEKDRKRANLKAIGARKYTHSTIDQNVQNGEYPVPVRVYFPNHDTLEEYKNDEANLPVIIYLHGGGWVTDGIDNYERICDKLAKYTNHIIVSVDYRLAPEHKFPIGLEDCYEVAKAICLGNFPGIAKHADVTIMGDSAGGNLATVVCQMARDKKEFSLTRQVLIYPVVYNDYSEESPYESVRSKGAEFILTAGRMRDYIALYQSCEADRKNPYFAPILAEDLSDLPKTLIITAENDPLRDEGEDYGSKLKNAGVETQIYRIENAIHGYFGVGLSGHFVRETLTLIARFLKEN